MYQHLRDQREDHDLSQSQLAAKLGMSQTGYSKYETGENDVPTGILIKLSNLYNVSIDYLLGQTEDPKRYYQGAISSYRRRKTPKDDDRPQDSEEESLQ